MAKPYSRDLRERMVQAGRSRHEVARIFEVSASCVIKLMHRYEATGDYAPGKFGGHKRASCKIHGTRRILPVFGGRSGRRSGRRGPELGDAEYLIDRER